MKTTVTFLTMLITMNVALYAQSFLVLNFEDEDETSETILHLHTEDFQTDPAYTRNTYELNPDKTGVNKTSRCASFSGYNSDNEWWYGFDIVLRDSVFLPAGKNFYVHALQMTNNTGVDTNRGLLSFTSGWAEVGNKWDLISDVWADYVFPIAGGAANIKELRFMFNHKAAGQITYIDEIVISDDSVSRTAVTGYGVVKANTKDLIVYSTEKTINVISSSENFNIEVYTVLGQLIFSRKINGNQINIPVNETGIYLVRSNQFSKRVFVK